MSKLCFILLNLATAAVLCSLLAACPRQQPEEEAVARKPAGQTSSAPATPATKELVLPLDYLELGTNMTSTPLPEEMLASWPDAEVSGDKSVLHVSFPEQGMDYWYHAFTSPASGRDLWHYYTGILGTRGFDANSNVNAESTGPEGYFQALFNTPDAKYGIRIYSADYDAAQAGEATPYILFLQDRSLKPVTPPESAATEGNAASDAVAADGDSGTPPAEGAGHIGGG